MIAPREGLGEFKFPAFKTEKKKEREKKNPTKTNPGLLSQLPGSGTTSLALQRPQERTEKFALLPQAPTLPFGPVPPWGCYYI